MRSFTTILACAASLLAAGPALAHPGHGDLVASLPLAARDGTLNTTSTGSSSNTSIADDHVPDFKAPECICAEVICDSRLNAASVSFRSSLHHTAIDIAPPPLLNSVFPQQGNDCHTNSLLPMLTTSDVQICQCQAQAKLACYKKSNGGCPKPDDNVSSNCVFLFFPIAWFSWSMACHA